MEKRREARQTSQPQRRGVVDNTNEAGRGRQCLKPLAHTTLEKILDAKN